ncbi:MAG: TonB-dependent receptor family protein [Dysgonamonadaceae bacterium]|jgi:outer membrane receptor protein involved in Fe transport|nr:TonB-dependent receptor family protein [Dysgonamonadaceae bacterium]
MKTLCISLFLLFMAMGVSAQTSGTVVRGQIVDSLSQETIPYATVRILNEPPTATPLHEDVTDADGRFQFVLKTPGKYVLQVEYLGKNTVSQPFVIEEKQTLDLGKIVLSDNEQLLDEVTITAQKALVKVDLDKITYNLEEDPEAKTNNLLEMLKKVPMVTVDGEENIQVKGSSNFKFYMNGKPSNLLSNNPKDVLRSIPAHTIKDVEVITDPGARYDAEGVTGIINIVTKNQSSLGGYTASLSAGGSSLGAVYGGTYFSLKYGKTGFTGNVNYNLINQPSTDVTSFRENYRNADHHFLTQSGWNKADGSFLMGFGEFSYEIDTLNLLNVNVNRYGVDFGFDQYMATVMQNAGRDDVYRYGQTSDGDNSQSGTTLGADYQRSFAVKDRLLTASYRLNAYDNNQDVEARIQAELNFNDSRNRQFSFSDSYEHTWQIDYTTPFAQIHNLEAGAKFIQRINQSRNGMSVLLGNQWSDIPSDNDDFRHIQDIWAAYAGYSLKYKSWGFKAGLRYEGTALNVNYPLNTARNFEADYSNLIPSATATYMLKPGQTLRGGYNLRIQRPGISYLNPYVNTTDTNYIRFGNPELDAVIYHNFNLNYNLYTPKFTMNANLSYGLSNNGISDFAWIDDYVSKTSYFNLLKEGRWNVSSYLSWTPTQKIRIFGNLSGMYSRLQSNREASVKNSGFSGNVYGGAQYTLPKDYMVYLNGYYSSPYVSLQGKGMSFYNYSLSASKSFLNKKLNIRLSASNFLAKNLQFKQTRESDDFYYRSENTRLMRQFSLSVSYSFGEMKAQIKKAQRSIRNDDQMQESSSESGGGASGGNIPN